MNTAVHITLKAAVMLALVLLLALGVSCLAADNNDDGTRGPESSAYDSLQRWEQRLQLLEEMLFQQRMEMARQGEMVAHQQLTMARQEEMLTHQQLTMARQEEMLTHQQLAMARQEEMLTHQQLTMARQEEMLTHQQLTMARQEETTRQLRKDRLKDRSELQVLRGKISFLKLYSAQSTDTDPRSSEDKPRVSDASAEHNRSSRSDDLGPLQATVLRLDQTVTQLTAQTQALSSKSDVMASDIHTASASAFVRWGHAQCPDHSDLVYSGVVGGSWYLHRGAATNYLCLTLKPTFGGHSVPTEYAYLYGAEYETHDSHFQMDALCAVCRARMSATVMIPGTDTCTDGWTRQFSGYLMAGYWNVDAGSEYICVDSSLQGRQGSIRDNNGKLLYYVLSQCGSLPCGPYVNNKVVSCVVCSK